MAIKDWTITVNRKTRAISRAGFGTPLILATDSDADFAYYTAPEDVSVDFDETTEAYKMANAMFAQTPKPTRVAIMGVLYEAGTDDPTTLTGALNSISEEFYFLTCEEQGVAEIEALSGWADSQQKLYGVSVADPTALDNLESERTFVMVHNDPSTYPAEAWIGKCAPQDPGSITWNYQELNGIQEGGTDDQSIKENNGNSYVQQHGVLHTYDGQTTTGEWIDVMRSQDFLYTRIDESVFATLFNANKVPYTNAGIAMIEAAIEAPIKQAANNGMVATDADGQFIYNVSAPTRAETTTQNRAERLLPDIEASVTLSGAVHGGDISLVIQV